MSAGAFSAAGAATNFNTFGDGVLRVGSFGAVGGIASVMAGGKFGHGFVSAGLGAASLVVPGTGQGTPGGHIKRAVVASIVGGTSSRISGGKFANGAATAAFAAIVSSAAQKASSSGQSSTQDGDGRTSVDLRHKNIPGGDTLGNTNPDAYPQYAYVIVRDNVTGEEWIARPGPGGEGGNAAFGSIKGITTRNVLGSTGDLCSGKPQCHCINCRHGATSDCGPAFDLYKRSKQCPDLI